LDTLFTGKIVHFKEETESTNDWADQEMKTSKVLEGTLFKADSQTKGKGQRGRHWTSVAGKNILSSYVFYPSFVHVSQQFCLVKAVSLALKDVLDQYLIDKVQIKWPNDIYVNDLKIAGVLIESAMKGSMISSSVVGIGLNVNQQLFDAKMNATSLILETGRGFDVNSVLSELSFFLERRYLAIRANQNAADIEYQQSLYKLDKAWEYQVGNESNRMINRGVDSLGQLLLEDEYGRTNPYGLHEARMVL
jgi:BirA family biotin operon repressor/biotin-[acetyl-CoA-carboxylase] ligase